MKRFVDFTGRVLQLVPTALLLLSLSVVLGSAEARSRDLTTSLDSVQSRYELLAARMRVGLRVVEELEHDSGSAHGSRQSIGQSISQTPAQRLRLDLLKDVTEQLTEFQTQAENQAEAQDETRAEVGATVSASLRFAVLDGVESALEGLDPEVLSTQLDLLVLAQHCLRLADDLHDQAGFEQRFMDPAGSGQADPDLERATRLTRQRYEWRFRLGYCLSDSVDESAPLVHECLGIVDSPLGQKAFGDNAWIASARLSAWADKLLALPVWRLDTRGAAAVEAASSPREGAVLVTDAMAGQVGDGDLAEPLDAVDTVKLDGSKVALTAASPKLNSQREVWLRYLLPAKPSIYGIGSLLASLNPNSDTEGEGSAEANPSTSENAAVGESNPSRANGRLANPKALGRSEYLELQGLLEVLEDATQKDQVERAELSALTNGLASSLTLLKVEIEDLTEWKAAAPATFLSRLDLDGAGPGQNALSLPTGTVTNLELFLITPEGELIAIPRAPVDEDGSGRWLLPGYDYLVEIPVSQGGGPIPVIFACPERQEFELVLPPYIPADATLFAVRDVTEEVIALANSPHTRRELAERMHAQAPGYIWDDQPDAIKGVFPFLETFVENQLPEEPDYLRKPENRLKAIAGMQRPNDLAQIQAENSRRVYQMFAARTPVLLPREELCAWIEPQLDRILGDRNKGWKSERTARNLRVEANALDPEQSYMVREAIRILVR